MSAEPARVAELLGGPALLGRDVRTTDDLAELVSVGLPKAALERLAEFLAPNPARRRRFVHLVVPRSTYRRRKLRLTPAESRRVERVARVAAWARHLWADDDDARHFLTAPHPLLDRMSVVEAARAEDKAERAEYILAALEWGLPV
jgi:putative toxin-antitoxin system antitoxin component (TIGR02293 family)